MAGRWWLYAAVLLSGCAAGRRDSTALAPEREPDCSFRSATTCWTLGARVLAPERAARDTAPDRLLRQPPAVLASRADTVAAR
jgi:hypothetical protein